MSLTLSPSLQFQLVSPTVQPSATLSLSTTSSAAVSLTPILPSPQSELLRRKNQVSSSTLRKYQSYLNLFRRHGLHLNDLLTNANRTIDSLINKRGDELSVSYKLKIAWFVRKTLPNSDIDPLIYKRLAASHIPGEQNMTDQHMKRINEVIHEAFAFQKRTLESIENHGDIDVDLYDTYVVVLLSIATCLRIREILDLKMLHLNFIERLQLVPIKTKTTRTPILIPMNRILESLFRWIRATRATYVKQVAVKVKIISDSRNLRYKNDYLILYSESFIRKKLIDIAGTGISFNSLRKYITSYLIAQGGHKLAKRLNRHRKLDTTIQHYAVNTNEMLNRFYDSKSYKYASDAYFTRAPPDSNPSAPAMPHRLQL